MTTKIDNPQKVSQSRSETREELKLREVRARDQMVQVDYRLQALEINFEECRAELARLEGFSLTGLFSALTGSKESKLKQIQDQCAEIEHQIDTCESEQVALQREVSEIEQAIAQALTTETSHESPLADNTEGTETQSGLSGDQPATRSAIDTIQKAIDACEETLRDLNNEQETTSTLGRCTVVDVKGVLGGMMNVSRHGTSKQCASRVSQSLRRFRNRLAAVMALNPTEGKEALGATDAELEEMEKNFSAQWLASSASGEESADHVERTLMTTNMLLEKLMNESRQSKSSCEVQ
ncbi:MAG: hypothetical protein ACE5EQ_10765 [Phycisphaerae bacterium]